MELGSIADVRWYLGMVDSGIQMTQALVYIFIGLLVFFQISGPLLPLPLFHHLMVRIGKGQAILGGKSGSVDLTVDFDPLLNYQANEVYHSKIYLFTCSNRNCIISLLERELSVQKGYFVAIPIPDTISGCITKGKNGFQKNSKVLCKQIFVSPQI